jgi:hypothetical protein
MALALTNLFHTKRIVSSTIPNASINRFLRDSKAILPLIGESNEKAKFDSNQNLIHSVCHEKFTKSCDLNGCGFQETCIQVCLQVSINFLTKYETPFQT